MSLVSGAVDLYMTYKFLRILTQPFNQTEQYQTFILDQFNRNKHLIFFTKLTFFSKNYTWRVAQSCVHIRKCLNYPGPYLSETSECRSSLQFLVFLFCIAKIALSFFASISIYFHFSKDCKLKMIYATTDMAAV